MFQMISNLFHPGQYLYRCTRSVLMVLCRKPE
uniref:Uncharacterized protein n=1 Tax=virus sp. ctkyY8 TaxID=2827995 RepID=A0A8S5RDV9_9VIRU|nr:MAG TPA: hypothetical protein [virus sp. ctkyY8]